VMTIDELKVVEEKEVIQEIEREIKKKEKQ
jgi:hypothetical protein